LACSALTVVAPATLSGVDFTNSLALANEHVKNANNEIRRMDNLHIFTTSFCYKVKTGSNESGAACCFPQVDC
jgi:hypothetical protein